MTGRELAARAGITVLVLGGLFAALAFSAYEWDFEPPWRYRTLYWNGLQLTLGATACAFLVGMVVGVGIALARMNRALWLRHLGDLYVEIVRGTPFIVQVSIAWWGIASQIAGVQSRFLVGTVALGVFAAAYMGEIIRAGIESVERGQFEAARSLGLDRNQTLRHVVFPQAFKRMIPPLTGELIALTKESSLLFTIGVVELMSVGNQMGADTLRTFEALLVVALLYLTLTVPLSLVARRLERRLGKSDRSGLDLL